ncbi:MAG TPA: efflux RND transporter periplasmic adaptor subunit [Terriglobales bacterium]|nr:efflux RND transporter periplasmic adaptor subunit [Terriglobales bacterium]
MSRFKLLLYCCVLSVLLTCASCTSGSVPAVKTPQATAAKAPVADAIKVVSQRLNTTVYLPSELIPYESVAVYPKVTGFVKWIKVDRGSRVRTGEVIAQLEAPEIVSERAEAQAKLQSAQGQLLAARAKLAADQSTYEKLKAAAATPGVVAKNELVIALQAAQADAADVQTAESNVSAAQQSLQSIRQMEGYLQIRAPFDGVVTERNVHPGALVGPASGTAAALPMVRVETLARLRLVVPVPETYVAGIPVGAKVSFTVPAFPDETFTGRIARISHALDQKTRTMPVEIDVRNPAGRLAPGSFSDVLWPVERPQPTLFVPSSAVASTLERIFVVRVKDSVAEWVDVKTGVTTGSLTEVFGNLQAGDIVLVHGTDEVRPGSRLTAHLASESK